MSCFISSIEEEEEEEPVLQSSHKLTELLSFSRQATIVGATRNKTKNNNTILAKVFMLANVTDTN